MSAMVTDGIWSAWKDLSGAPATATISGQKLTTTDASASFTARREHHMTVRGGDEFDFYANLEVQSGICAMWVDIDTQGATTWMRRFSRVGKGLLAAGGRVAIPWKNGNVCARFGVGVLTADQGVGVWEFPSITLVRGVSDKEFCRGQLISSGAGAWTLNIATTAPRWSNIALTGAVVVDSTGKTITVTTQRSWANARPPLLQPMPLSAGGAYVAHAVLGASNTIIITIRDYAGVAIDPATILSGSLDLIAWQ